MPERRDADVLVLCYHAVRKAPVCELDVSERALRSQVELLLRKGYRGSTFCEALIAPAAPRTLAVTFDDGDRSVFDAAFPLLAELGLPATLFVATHTIGAPGGLAADELRELAAAGWEIGSHTVSHERLTELGERDLDVELRESRTCLEGLLGQPCRSLAYPFGAADARVIAAAEDAGYVAACVLSGRFASPSLLAWPRVGVASDDELSIFRVKTAPLVRRVRGSVVGESLNVLARKLRHSQRERAAA